MSEADKLKELFDIAWDIQIHNKDKNEELVKKVIRYMPDIMQQFDYLENKEITPSKTLEELGYEKSENEYNITFRKDNTIICFVKKLKVFSFPIKDLLTNNGKFVACNVTMEELKAIYKYCEDLGWI